MYRKTENQDRLHHRNGASTNPCILINIIQYCLNQYTKKKVERERERQRDLQVQLSKSWTEAVLITDSRMTYLKGLHPS